MKTTILISGAGAALATNCVRQIAEDNGITIPDMIMDQLPNILITAAGLLSAFLGWLSHRNVKQGQAATITSLAASNEALAVSAVQTPQ